MRGEIVVTCERRAARSGDCAPKGHDGQAAVVMIEAIISAYGFLRQTTK